MGVGAYNRSSDQQACLFSTIVDYRYSHRLLILWVQLSVVWTSDILDGILLTQSITIIWLDSTI